MKRSSPTTRVSTVCCELHIDASGGVCINCCSCAAVAVDTFATSVPSNAEALFDVAGIESLQQPAVLGKPRRRRRSTKKHGAVDPSVRVSLLKLLCVCMYFHVLDVRCRASSI
jgi:hypothetical protein